jgi:uncharacterized membrane protein YccC
VMLGAVSGRYATIAGATLILSIYTMIGADQPAARALDPWHEPLLLLAGAAWYGVLSLGWSVLSPQQAIRHALARLFDSLADTLDGKAALFAPLPGVDREALQLALAMQNEQVVTALNDTRLVLIDRIGTRRARGATAARLQLYFVAQDIHERISSSHYPYDALAEAFFHSDVLFRCEHLLRLEAQQCRRRAETLRLRLPLEDDIQAATALADVHAAVDAATARCRIRARDRCPRRGRAFACSSPPARGAFATRCAWPSRCWWATACCMRCIRRTATGFC